MMIYAIAFYVVFVLAFLAYSAIISKRLLENQMDFFSQEMVDLYKKISIIIISVTAIVIVAELLALGSSV